ncbi:PREDICTED: circularly permutated Ras protein 1-like [Nanorana parkeri]|uniref:circularly permutated Ras protein 1-like n=1 Tax=Nanorana parkeri TaxID=125878 RepID=UPI000854FD71|nr:PREDICTED: circularly permutated Ras protein 1-like [Nanorana parkeri]
MHWRNYQGRSSRTCDWDLVFRQFRGAQREEDGTAPVEKCDWLSAALITPLAYTYNRWKKPDYKVAQIWSQSSLDPNQQPPACSKADSASPGKANELPQQLAHNRLSLETNVYQGFQLPSSPKPERKTPPPVPERKTKPSSTNRGICTPSAAFKMNLQNPPPPIPVRKEKPSEYRSGNMESAEYDYAYEVMPEPGMESKEQRLPANCNILLMNIGKMVEDTGIENFGFPLLCRSCSAAFSELSHVDENKTWTCDFCSTENSVTEHTELRCTGDDQLYLQAMSGNVYTADDDTMLIFCIDISGSMSVTIEVPQDQTNNCSDHNMYQSRMEAVKSGLTETLHLLHKQNPRQRVALVAFSDQVKIYGDGTIQPQVLEDCELLDTDYLKSQGENQPVPQILEETLHLLEAKIECLKENGATALGPAALMSIAMASKRPGSKVIICTDGRANTDLGNLENITEEYVYQSSKLYYSNLGDLALQHSVVVSVVTIEGTDCRLPELGQLADKTGGKVNIVHPSNLAKEFQSILDEQINATDVEVKVYLPHSMHFFYEAHTEPILQRKLGSTNADTVLSTEFTIHSSKTKEVLRHSQLPVQVQLTYTLADGRSIHRIISQKRPVTNDRFKTFVFSLVLLFEKPST